jgi:hypothetical protein
VCNWLRAHDPLSGLFRFSFRPDANFFDDDEQTCDFFGANRGGSKFLDRFTVDDMTSLIEHSRVGHGLRARGVDDWFIEFDLRDCFVHYCYLRRRCLPEPDRFIGFLIIQLCEFGMRRGECLPLPPGLDLLNVRWLALQDPLSKFSDRRPRLPGQRFPGTGLGRDAYDTLMAAATRAGRVGIVNVPEHFHNAFMYQKFRFLNPADEAAFRRMRIDLAADIKTKGLAPVSWAIYLGFLRSGGKRAIWEPKEQAFAISKKLRAYFKGRDYKAAMHEAMGRIEQFTIEWEGAERFCLSAILQGEAPPASPRKCPD